VAGLIFLAIGVVCALIGRLLLIGAAFRVSIWWGLGVFLPFGSLLFRLSYPDVAPTSRYFRLAVFPCLLAYFVFQPNGFSKLNRWEAVKSAKEGAAPADRYALEKVPRSDVEKRLIANECEFQRLNAWSIKLSWKKRDLLHSDAQGNVAYDAELAQYQAALAKATTEKQALFGSIK
jgi:hypothetical protein